MIRSPHVALALLSALIAAGGACERRREFIGRLSSSSGPGDGGPVTDGASLGDAADVGAGDTISACSPTGAGSPGPAPSWTCAGQDRCLSEADLPVARSVFDSAPPETDAARQPRLVYPLAGSVHPINLPRITLQWKRALGAGQTAFRIAIAPMQVSAAPYLLHVGHRPPAGPTPAEESDAVYEVPEAVWRWIARESAGGSVSITVSAYDPSRGTVATSAPVTVRFSAGPLDGGLHYLSTEPPSAGINRYLFGARGSHLLVPVTPGAGPTSCIGCHSVSRDGARIGFAASYAGSLTVVPTADVSRPLIEPLAPPSEANGISPALSPDGQRVLARDGVNDRVTIYRVSDGVALSVATPVELGGRIDYPEWSADGSEIVATRAPIAQAAEYSASDGELVIIPVSVEGRLGSPRPVVAEVGQVHAHPSWSPDGDWIVFSSSPRTGTPTHGSARSVLRLVRRDGGTIYTLTRASGGEGHASTYPKFAPVGQQGCQLLFVVFQSRMDYGLVRRTGALADPVSPQLWLSAIEVGSPEPDPSSPPVWLPFQDPANKNLLPAWSDRITCSTDVTCGPTATCRTGLCAPAP